MEGLACTQAVGWRVEKTGIRNRPLQKRERTGKEYGCFPFV